VVVVVAVDVVVDAMGMIKRSVSSVIGHCIAFYLPLPISRFTFSIQTFI